MDFLNGEQFLAVPFTPPSFTNRTRRPDVVGYATEFYRAPALPGPKIEIGADLAVLAGYFDTPWMTPFGRLKVQVPSAERAVAFPVTV